MDRRKFVKLLGGFALMGAVPAGASVLSNRLSPLAGCRITVLRRECFAELQDRYLDDPETGPCHSFATGQSFDIPPGCQCAPGGFCRKAWQAIESAMSDNDAACASMRRGAILVTCPDATRPVVFKVEW